MEQGESQRRAAVLVAGSALVLAVAATAPRSWWVRAFSCALVAAIGVGITGASVGMTPMVIAAGGVMISSAALSGWPLLPVGGPMGAPLQRPAVLAVPLIAAAGGMWHRTLAPAVAGLLLLGAVSVLVLYRLSPGRVTRVDGWLVRATVALATWISTAVLAVVAVPLLWIPGAVAVAVRWMSRRIVPRPGGWRAVGIDHVDQRRDSGYPFATADRSDRRRQLIGGGVIAVVAILGTVAAIRAGDPVVVRQEVVVGADGTAPPSSTPGDGGEQRPPVAHSSQSAGAGLDWVDEVQAEHAAVPLPPGAVGGFDLGDYQTRFTNIADGSRVSYQAAACDCEVFDIWFIGGSAGFGVAQRDDHTIASELVRRAEADGVAVKVTNLAVPGYTLWQEYQKVLARLARGDDPPDLIIFYDGLNDVLQSFVQTVVYGPRWDEPVVFSSAALNDLSTLSAGDVLDRVETNGGTPEIGARAGERYIALRNLIRSQLEAEGIASAFFFQPDATTSPVQRAASAESDDRLVPELIDAVGETAAVVAAAADRTGTDLRHVYDGHTAPYFFDIGHTNEAGAAVVADAIHAELTERYYGRRAGG